MVERLEVVDDDRRQAADDRPVVKLALDRETPFLLPLRSRASRSEVRLAHRLSRWLPLLGWVAGCSGDAGLPTPSTGIYFSGEKTLSDVSRDQDFLLYLTNESPTGPAFDVWEQPLPSGAPLRLAEQAMAFGGIVGETAVRADAALDGLFLWVPPLVSAWRIGTGHVENLYYTPDGRGFAWWQAPTAAANAGDLRYIQIDECSAAGCVPHKVADGVSLSITRLSADLRFAAYTSLGPAGRELHLVDLSAANDRLLTTATAPLDFDAPFFSPDGTLAAVLAYDSLTRTAPASLRVYATVSGAAVDWAQPSGSEASAYSFSDDSTIATWARDPSRGSSGIYLLTAGAAKLVADTSPSAGVPSYRLLNGGRYVLTEVPGTASLDARELRLYDAATPMAPPLLLTRTANFGASIDDAQKQLLFIEDVDSMTLEGNLVVVSIPDGGRTVVARVSAVLSGALWRGAAAAFSLGGDAVVYLDTASRLHVWRAGADQVAVTAVYDFRTAASPPMLYYTVSDPTAPEPVGIHGRPLP
jgi:hypothetical protein